MRLQLTLFISSLLLVPVNAKSLTSFNTESLTSFNQKFFEVIKLRPRENIELDYMYLAHQSATANVILFVGGKGKLKFREKWLAKKGGNFLLRSRDLFKAEKLNVAIFNAASDQRSATGLKDGGRTSPEHLTDIIAVIDDIQLKNSLPVWLVGTSRGTESVAWAAIHINEKIKGIVLTSSISESNNHGISLPEMALQKIQVAVLLIAHKDDDCIVTPSAGAKIISARLTGAEHVSLFMVDGEKLVDGGNAAISEPCKARSAHGFYGIEGKVVRKISEFINKN